MVCRTSGSAIGGSGSEMSSMAMVTFIPGRSSACSGSIPSGWFSAQRMAAFTFGTPGERLAREDHPRVQRQVLEQEVLAEEEHPGRAALLGDDDVPFLVVQPLQRLQLAHRKSLTLMP